MIYINVAVNNKSKYIDTLFTYKTCETVHVGDLVLLPFGKYNSKKEAIVCQLVSSPQYEEDKIKEIFQVTEREFLTEEMVKTALWMKQRYGIKYYDALNVLRSKEKILKKARPKNRTKTSKEATKSLMLLPLNSKKHWSK